MAKMTGFKVFKGTKAAFEASGKASANNDAIVFITGGTDGNKGSCIYTQGAYFGSITELMKAINYVKGVKVGNSEYNAAKDGGFIPFAAADNSTVSLDVQNGTITIGLTEAFVKKVNDTETNLGTKNDAADKDGSAFARIANLAALVSDLTGGSTDSIEGQITSAINSLRTEIVGTLGTGDSATLEKINDEIDSMSAILAGLSNIVVSGNLEGKIQANTDAIAVLNGNDTTTGSVDKKIKDAINDFSTKVSDDGTINTFKELIDYAAGVDGSDTLAEAIAQINENKGKIETLNGDSNTAGSVDKKVKDAIDAEVSRADGKYYVKPTGGIPKADLDSGVQASLGKADTAVQGFNDGTNAYAAVTTTKNGDNSYDISVNITTKNIADATAQAQGVADAYDVKTYVDSTWEWEEL